MTSLISVLKKIALFHGLTDEQLARVAAVCVAAHLPEGSAIVERGAPGDRMYIITDGQVEVRRGDGRGAERTTVFLGEGQVFGEIALLDQGARMASVVAAEGGAHVYMLDRTSFETLCRSDMSLGYIMMRNLALDLAFKLRHTSADISASASDSTP